MPNKTTETESLVTYWAFYWPLTLTGLAMVLSIQFQNATLARFPDAITELAVFAIAQSTFSLFAATLNFTPQLSNMFARSHFATRRSARFVLCLSLLMTALPLLLALTPPGQWLIASVYRLDDKLLAKVCSYLVWLAPVLILNGQRFFINGQLVQARLTGWVTALNVAFLIITVLLLMAGFSAGIKPVYVLCGAQFCAALIHLALGWWVRRRFYRLPATPEHERLCYSELTQFFLPITTTGVMFAISRPILYAFVARTPDALVAIAALRVAFDVSMMFQQAANQFRNFFVTFGLTNLRQKRNFMWLVGCGLTLMMGVFAATPLSGWLLMGLLGVDAQIYERAVQVIVVMCLLPGIILWRNYYHGILMVERRTNSMALGGLLRVCAIALAAFVLARLGWLDHITAAFVLLLGFCVETWVVAMGRRYAKPARKISI